MRRFVLALLLPLLLLVLGVPPSFAARKAMVVGIDRYDNLPAAQQLDRAVNDASAIASTLASLHFAVTPGKNLSRAQFNALWQAFLDAIKPGDDIVIYFAGHGVEIEGLNFLIPRDIPAIRFGRQEQLKRESISVSELLLDLRRKRPQASIVILDACRDHPFVPDELRATPTGRGGLAEIKDPGGTFIMYSAGAGQTALDRLPDNDSDKLNSVYTRKLLPLMRQPGLTLTDLAQRVRREVHDLAATVPHPQTPAYYDGLLLQTPFCLAGCGPAPDDGSKDLVAAIAAHTDRGTLLTFIGHPSEAVRKAAARRLSELADAADKDALAKKKTEEDRRRASADAERLAKTQARTAELEAELAAAREAAAGAASARAAAERERDELRRAAEEARRSASLMPKQDTPKQARPSRLVQYILPNSPVYGPGDTIKIKLSAASRYVKAHAVFPFGPRERSKAEMTYSIGEGGLYIPFKVPQGTAPGLYEVKVYVQEIQTRAEEQHTVEIEIR
jgi:hypothetical protein